MHGILDSLRHNFGIRNEKYDFTLTSPTCGSTCPEFGIEDDKGTELQRGPLAGPVRQTIPIFQQPVTVHKTQESKVKANLKYGNQTKPLPLLWKKVLGNQHAHVIRHADQDYRRIRKHIKFFGLNVKLEDESELSELSESSLEELKWMMRKKAKPKRRRAKRWR